MSVLASLSDTTVNEIAHFIGEAGLPGVFALMALSCACVPIPSEFVLLFAGFAAADPAQAGTSHHLGFAAVVLVALAGTMVGSWLAYAVGRFGRLELFERHGARIHMGPAQVQRAEDWFARRGEAAVLVGRVIPVVRAFISLPAGVARMNIVRFSVYSLLGAIPWVVGLTLGGEALGSNWKSVRTGFEDATYAVVALVVVWVAYRVLRRRRLREAPAADLLG